MGKDKSQKSDRTRKPEVFVLQLSAGLRCLESRSLLEETMENCFCNDYRSKVMKRSRPLVKKVGATSEVMEVDETRTPVVQFWLPRQPLLLPLLPLPSSDCRCTWRRQQKRKMQSRVAEKAFPRRRAAKNRAQTLRGAGPSSALPLNSDLFLGGGYG